jgi:hypothetical protein
VSLLAASAWILFYGYTGLLVVAGVWGMLAGRFDQRLLFGLDPDTLPPRTAASLVSQYRFLRAIEAGFGAFALLYRGEIFTEAPFNTLFLTAMAMGVAARLVSLARDGRPRTIFYFFLISEGVGVVLIYLQTRHTLA